ncbi:MAG: HypC/HybG/HupF family hydrogenase formation chaperone [Balneolaceae bacterium]|nr:MAG: HypC/HybG/HupF family hydrogenase formation chaperone [Balneolaceae bacterium]
MCLAIPGKVISLEPDFDEVNYPGKVSFGGIVREVNFCFLPEAEIGDYVLVHVGVALSKVDENEAMLTLKYLDEMGELDDLKTPPEKLGEWNEIS